jgi:hypothetical protein
MDEPRLDPYWTRDKSGKLIMPELQSRYLDWLLEEDRQGTDKTWARENGVSWETIKKWKQDPRFKEMWERRSVERNLNPGRLQKMIDVLYESAVKSRDYKAAKDYLSWAEKFLPPKEIRRDNTVSHLTDDELIAEIEALVQEGL